MTKLKDRMVINPKYQSTLAPLTDEEAAQLEANILNEGGFLSPILYHLSEDGQEVIVDGHHRQAIWEDNQDNVELMMPAYRDVSELSGATEDEVVEWIRNHQKGRRNLPTLLEQYEMGQEVIEARENGSTLAEYAEKNEVTPSKAGHAANLARAVDEGEEASPGFRDQILADENASASGAIQKARDLNATEPSPLMAFEAVQSLLGKLSRAVEKVRQAFPDVHDAHVPASIKNLYEDVKGWEDQCAKEIE